MRSCSYAIADLLPHAPPMVLLDAVESWNDDRAIARVTIRPGIPFHQAGYGVPVHVGIEYMAQACGAFAGLEALAAGEPVRIGYLLGTRAYRATLDWFTDGMQLTVSAVQVFRDGTMGVFDCAIMAEGRELATAQLNVYQPDETAEPVGGPDTSHG